MPTCRGSGRHPWGGRDLHGGGRRGRRDDEEALDHHQGPLLRLTHRRALQPSHNVGRSTVRASEMSALFGRMMMGRSWSWRTRRRPTARACPRHLPLPALSCLGGVRQGAAADNLLGGAAWSLRHERGLAAGAAPGLPEGELARGARPAPAGAARLGAGPRRRGCPGEPKHRRCPVIAISALH